MDITGTERADLAARIAERADALFDYKSDAYKAAGVNPATWDKVIAGDEVRTSTLRKVVRALWPESNGDLRKIPSRDLAPAARDEERLDALERMIADVTRRVEALELRAGAGYHAADSVDLPDRPTSPGQEARTERGRAPRE